MTTHHRPHCGRPGYAESVECFRRRIPVAPRVTGNFTFPKAATGERGARILRRIIDRISAQIRRAATIVGKIEASGSSPRAIRGSFHCTCFTELRIRVVTRPALQRK
jgi:hypothetical protein